jgi:uncharacterized protein YbjT (DUF2867 family)
MILIVGATGELGGRVLALLRGQGHQVRGLVRPGTDYSALVRLGADIAHGDLTEPGSLAPACEAVDTVVTTATVIARRLAGSRRPSIYEVDQVGMAALIDAAERAGVERFVYLSYAGVDAGLETPLERAKLATEQRLKRSPMRTVIIRPDAYQEIHLAALGRFDMARGKVAIFGTGDTKRRWVSTDDVAALVAAVIAEPDPPTLIEFGGSEAISRNEAVTIAERLTGRTFKRQRMPLPLARLAMRVLARPNDALASVFGTGVVQDVVSPTWDDAPLRQRGIPGKSASEFLQEQARALP